MKSKQSTRIIDMELDFSQFQIPDKSIVAYRCKLWELHIIDIETDFVEMFIKARVRLIEYDVKHLDDSRVILHGVSIRNQP